MCIIFTLKVKPLTKVYKVPQYVNTDFDKTPAKTLALGYVVNILSHSVNVSFRKACSVSNAVAWLRCCGLQGKHTFLSSTRRLYRSLKREEAQFCSSSLQIRSFLTVMHVRRQEAQPCPQRPSAVQRCEV